MDKPFPDTGFTLFTGKGFIVSLRISNAVNPGVGHNPVIATIYGCINPVSLERFCRSH